MHNQFENEVYAWTCRHIDEVENVEWLWNKFYSCKIEKLYVNLNKTVMYVSLKNSSITYVIEMTRKQAKRDDNLQLNALLEYRMAT